MKKLVRLHKFFKEVFKKNSKIDEDGFYHYLLEENQNDLVIDTTHITKWKIKDLSNKLILSYNDNNIFSLTWIREGKDLININHSLVNDIKFTKEVYMDENDKEIKRETIVLYLDDLTIKYLEIQIKPYISVCLKNSY